MSRKTKLLSLALGLVVLGLPWVSGITGNREGNGGDHVRATYLKMGSAVLTFLQTTKTGGDLVAAKGLDLAALENTLDIQVVSVVEGELKDNGGADVDATGEPGRVVLKKEAWIEHFEKERDVYYLVFHEMLRAAGVNDDNYVISAPLHPFPGTMKVVTRIAPLLPLVGGDLVESMFDLDKVSVNGSGCSINEPGTFVDFDAEKNVLEISTRRYLAVDSPTGSIVDTRKNCALAIPLSVPAGKRLVISQLDLAGRVNLPVGAKATINLEAFSTGLVGPKVAKTVEATSQEEVGRVQIRLPGFYATACGGYPILRLNTSARVSASSGDTATARVDRVALYLKVEDCR